MKQPNLQAKEVHKQANSHQLLPKIISSPSDLFRPTETNLESSTMSIADAPAIRATYRISIPYGYQTPLPLLDSGHSIMARGHGGCTSGEQATVAITITQSLSGAVATGNDEHPCTGQLHFWNALVTADTSIVFVDGAAEACGFATTRDTNGYVTDTYAWCRDIELVTLNQHIYLPMIKN